MSSHNLRHDINAAGGHLLKQSITRIVRAYFWMVAAAASTTTKGTLTACDIMQKMHTRLTRDIYVSIARVVSRPHAATARSGCSGGGKCMRFYIFIRI